ncbi:MAG: hypothetical protein GY852_10485, partial [bacterium]|nr:hypothetical protein [bacterium]
NQALLDALPCVALLIRPKTREVVASNKAGRDVGAVPGSLCYSTWGQRNDPCPWCLAPKLWEENLPQNVEVEGLGEVWDTYWIPVQDDLYLHYAFDITEKRKMESQLQQTHKMEAIGTLAGGIAHDFNNILGIIVGNTEMAMDGVPEWKTVGYNLEEIRTASLRARDIVKQIVAFSRQTKHELKSVNI